MVFRVISCRVGVTSKCFRYILVIAFFLIHLLRSPRRQTSSLWPASLPMLKSIWEIWPFDSSFTWKLICLHVLQLGPVEGAIFADYGTDLASGPTVLGTCILVFLIYTLLFFLSWWCQISVHYLGVFAVIHNGGVLRWLVVKVRKWQFLEESALFSVCSIGSAILRDCL